MTAEQRIEHLIAGLERLRAAAADLRNVRLARATYLEIQGARMALDALRDQGIDA